MILDMFRDGVKVTAPTPPFVLLDVEHNDVRVKRLRVWSGNEGAANLLPWLALNPSGANRKGTGLSGRVMARFAFQRGFDGIATYNIFPFAGSKPRRDLWPRLEKDARGAAAEIEASYDFIAGDLAKADALIVGWGSHGRAHGQEVERFAKQLVAKINLYPSRTAPPIRLLHLGLNGDGTPKHAGARGRSRIVDDIEPEEFILA